ncbi:MAG TPA: M1 family metallopeptidase [Vicinamibacterales bacterium]|nr:M1 family metallopeptidase [Vicinamibacterales bacterium]
MFRGAIVAAAILTLGSAASVAVHSSQAPAPPREVTAGSAGIPADTPLSPRNANYRIRARLDPEARTITGEEVITWRNVAAVPAATLQFHLYYNAWRNTRSTWMRERMLAGHTALAHRPAADWGWIDVTKMQLAGEEGADDLLSRARFIAPDDGNREDRTVLEVPLERPVQPGDTIEIAIGWTSRVPRTFARTGAIGHFFFIAQWFPKIGVLEDTGWNTHQFHAATEFFADFGVYDVQLDVPRGWVVGATGRELSRTDEGDRSVHRYYQADVHDFAWTTSPDYVERRARFEHPTLPAVDMRLLLQPEHAAQADRHFAATRAALRSYGEWFGAYPYGHVTIVDPAWQSGAGGMEYPTLFTAGTRWLAPRHATQPESVTIHEAGHQFWYGIVATNEVEHAWLDEGLNTYSTARVMEEAFYPQYYSKRYFGGFIPWVFRGFEQTREVDGNRMTAFRPVAKYDDQSTPTWRYWPASASAITYNKTALWLHTLERMLGWETLQRILSTYFQRYAFRHPKPEDFFAVANEVSGQDLTWFFDQVHRSSNVFDYAVDVLRSEPAVDRGHLGASEGYEVRGSTYRTTVVVRRLGEAQFPVDLLVRFENGEAQRWAWDGRDRWRAFETETPARAVSAEVDPERILVLDVNRTNNSVTLKPSGAAAARKWSLAWLIWVQDHLLTYGFFL